jgi:sterol desaturase/sphingolipid hydroxylase (fatty acid hydroxylase superfamily)
MTSRKLIISLGGFAAAACLLYMALGRTLARALDARFGPRVLQMAAGKTTDSRMFIRMRLREVVLLLTAAALITLAQLLAVALIKRKCSPRLAWILSALSGFVCLNAFAVVFFHRQQHRRIYYAVSD